MDEKLTEILQVRLTRTAMSKLRERAQQERRTLSQWVRVRVEEALGMYVTATDNDLGSRPAGQREVPDFGLSPKDTL